MIKQTLIVLIVLLAGTASAGTVSCKTDSAGVTRCSDGTKCKTDNGGVVRCTTK